MKKILTYLFLPIAFLLGIYLAISLLWGAVSSIFKIDFPWQYENVVETPLEAGIKGKTNGGLTVNEIKEFNKSDNLPYREDTVRDFAVLETDKYVVISRNLNGSDKFPNLSFVKTDKGLVYDGAWGVSAKVPVDWWTGKRDFNNAQVHFDFAQSSYKNTSNWSTDFWGTFWASSNSYFQNAMNTENIVTLSDFKTTFAPGFNNVAVWHAPWKADAERTLKNFIDKKIKDNIMFPYFQEFTDNETDLIIELVNGIENMPLHGLSAEEMSRRQNFILGKINSYATHLFEQSRTNDKKPNNAVVDLSDYFASFIPENLQTNFPISLEAEKTKFAGFDFYPIYNSRVFGNVSYKYENIKIDRNSKKIEDNFEIKVKKDEIEERPVVTTSYSLVTAKFKQLNETDYSSVNLSLTPVSLTVGGKTLNYNSKSDLEAGKVFALEKNKNHNYEIFTNSLLIFDSYNGNFKPTTNSSELVLNFNFYNNEVPVSVKLQPISGLDTSKINLAETPVTIAFVNSETNQTKTFRFNNNSLFGGITELLPIGNYTFTIVSSNLKFNEISGTIIITAETRNQLFTFWVEQENELSPSIQITSSYETGIWNADLNHASRTILQVKFNEAFYDVVEHLGTPFRVVIVAFDSDGSYVGSDAVDISSSTISTGFLISANNHNIILEPGESYRFQVRFDFLDNSQLLTPVSNLILLVNPNVQNFYLATSLKINFELI